MDRFLKIASQKIEKREDLVEVTPKPFTENLVTLNSTTNTPFKTVKRPSTKNEIDNLVKKEREKYEEFLADYAPVIQSYRKIINLKEFTVDGTSINIPHYEGPVGNVLKVYESKFTLSGINENKAYYVCFKGVDYIAEVFINGNFVGRHEGFFAPFEFDISKVVKQGENVLTVKVYNDFIYGGNEKDGVSHEGDKLYAATGIGWDGPYDGWHHCPPGMGIYNSVTIEERNLVYISDLFVRPMLDKGQIEVWIDAFNYEYVNKNLTFNVSVYGQNFKATVVENATFETFGDENFYLVNNSAKGKYKLPSQQGVNTYKVLIDINNYKLWTLNKPYLYKIQVSVLYNNEVLDGVSKQFGMRSFVQDTQSEIKGAFYLNGNKIKLRGANTMGYEQLDVLRGDYNQLVEDMILAKVCNMNFLRLTQRPVQEEIYEVCDKLGLLVQTDLPLFGVMRRTKFAEGVRQAEEMEKLVRNHPCVALVSLINEPFQNAHNRPHRHLMRNDLDNFFLSCEHIIKLNNPDRVIKYVDGDYDPPSKQMPDNHCYCLWYNGHTVDVGKLIKGYWCDVKPNWYYGCGEFGIEGFDYEEVMRNYYPSEWIAEPFDPYNILNAQTGSCYRYFYPRQTSLKGWIKESQRHQAEGLKIMTEAFRRNNDMVTFAVHLFIDAWPNGWMKTIMDFKRNPKPAFYAYRNALEPIIISLRTDRFTYFEGETIKIESYICNDTNLEEYFSVVYEVYNGKGEFIKTASVNAKTKDYTSEYLNTVSFTVDSVENREKFTVKAILVKNGNAVTYTEQEIEVFKKQAEVVNENVKWLKLDVGEYEIAGEKVIVKPLENGSHFVEVSKESGLTKQFKPLDFRYFYDKSVDRITPIVTKTIKCSGFTPILLTANHEATDSWAYWRTEYAVAEKVYNGIRYIIYTADLRNENPIVQRFINAVNAKQ